MGLGERPLLLKLVAMVFIRAGVVLCSSESSQRATESLMEPSCYVPQICYRCLPWCGKEFADSISTSSFLV